MDKFLKAVDFINTWAYNIVAFLILFLLAITLYGVIMRYAFDMPPMWGSQVLLLLWYPVAALAGGYVLFQDEHIRIDLIYSRWSAKGKAIANIATFAFFLLFSLLLMWATIRMAWVSTAELETQFAAFRGPIYPKKIVLALSVVLLLIQGVAQFVRNIQFLMGKQQRD